jgi:hypothetical protein
MWGSKVPYKYFEAFREKGFFCACRMPVGNQNPPALELSRDSDIGYAWGLHLGGTFRLTKRIGINAEACRRAAKVAGRTIGHLPLSMGIRDKL